MSGIIKKMSQVIMLAVVIEMFSKFTPVISLYFRDGEWSYSNKLVKEIVTISRGVRFIAASESESGSKVNSSKDIAFNAIGEDRDGVHLNEIARVFWSKTLSTGFLLCRFSFCYQQTTGTAMYGDFVEFGYSTLCFKVTEYSAHSGLRYWFYAGTGTDTSQSESNGGFINSRMTGSIVNNEAFNKGMNYSVPSMDGSCILWG